MIREDFENNVDNIIINRYAALYNEEPHANMIRRIAREEGLKKAAFVRSIIAHNRIYWTKEEDKILREYFPTIGGRGLHKTHLPNRTRSAICKRATMLGVTMNKEAKGDRISESLIKYNEKKPKQQEANTCVFSKEMIKLSMDFLSHSAPRDLIGTRYYGQ